MRNVRSLLVFHPALWGLIALQSLVIAVWIAIDPRVSFTPAPAGQLCLALGICLLVAGVIATCYSSRRPLVIAERVRIVATGFIFLVVTFVGIRLLNYLTMSLALPLADDLLDSWDKALGIDWYAYASWLGQYPGILTYIQIPYALTIPSVGLIFVALVLFGKIARAREFATLLSLGALLTVSVSGFFPAEAAMVRYMDDHLLALFGGDAGVYHMETLTFLRESKEITLNFADLPGLATFPSFHTIAGLLIVYACRDNVITLLLASVWTGAMLLATPVYGGHYIIDIIAGFVVTGLLAAAYMKVGAAHFTLHPVAAADARI